MRVSVVINPRAGAVLISYLRKKIHESLFRCDLKFYFSHSKEDYLDFLREEIEKKTSAFLICGGDGTLNETLQVLMALKETHDQIPPLALVSSGTANDLAFEMGISRRVDRAARLIFEGQPKAIDVIELKSETTKKYMITNGGIGIPAQAAMGANHVKGLLQKLARDESLSLPAQLAGLTSYRLTKSLGPALYSAILVRSILSWSPENWEFQIESKETGLKLKTHAPFLLVNNQSYIGGKHVVAPLTQNQDGKVNLSLFESKDLYSRLASAYRVRSGKTLQDPNLKSFELQNFSIESSAPDQEFLFFGDGEVLFKGCKRLDIQCVKGAALIYAND